MQFENVYLTVTRIALRMISLNAIRLGDIRCFQTIVFHCSTIFKKQHYTSRLLSVDHRVKIITDKMIRF